MLKLTAENDKLRKQASEANTLRQSQTSQQLQRIKELEAQVIQLTDECSGQQQKMAGQLEEIKNLTQQISQQQDELDHQKQLLAESEGENSSQRAKIQELQQQVMQQQSDMNSALQKLKQENEKLKLDVAEKDFLKSSQMDKNKQIKELESKLADSNLKANQLEVYLKTARDEQAALGQKAQTLDEENGKWRVQVKELQSQLATQST